MEREGGLMVGIRLSLPHVVYPPVKPPSRNFLKSDWQPIATTDIHFQIRDGRAV
jgi:hypothetical protein